MRNRLFIITAICLLSQSLSLANETSEEGTDFFETNIRPVLVKHCYECHATDAKKVLGGLLLDTREGIRQGGDSGASVVPGNLQESLLLDVIRYESFEMPPKQKLPPEVIADFEKWIKMGAPDPRKGSVSETHSEINIAAGRKFWSFQPIKKTVPPHVEDSTWPETVIDQYISARHSEAGIEPVDDASRTVLIRRATFALIGLSPTPEEIDSFLNDPLPTKSSITSA